MVQRSIAVLPLQTNPQDADWAYIGTALAAYLASDFGRHIPDSLIMAPASALTVASMESNPIAAGGKLGAHYVLNGHVTRTLAGYAFDFDLWVEGKSESVANMKADETLGELHALRRKVTGWIADILGVPLIDESGWDSAWQSGNPEIADMMLHATALMAAPASPETINQSRRLMETVLSKDPHAVAAMTGLASIHLLLALGGGSRTPLEDVRRTETLMAEALNINPGDLQAKTLQGAILRLRHRPVDAAAAYQTAVSVNPSFASAHAELGRLLVDLGQPVQAMASIDRALRLSPLDPERPLWLTIAGIARLHDDAANDAIVWFEKALALNPRFLTARIWLAAAFEADGQDENARAQIRQVSAANPRLTIRQVRRHLEVENSAVQRQREKIINDLRAAGLPDQ